MQETTKSGADDSEPEEFTDKAPEDVDGDVRQKFSVHSAKVHSGGKNVGQKEKSSDRRRHLPAWMLKKPSALDDLGPKPSSARAIRSVTSKPKISSNKFRRKQQDSPNLSDASDEEEEEAEEEEEEEEEPHSGHVVAHSKKSAEKSFRQRRAAAVKVNSYAEKEFVQNNSEFSDSSEEETKINKRRRKNESDEEYEIQLQIVFKKLEFKDEATIQNDSGSDFEPSWHPAKKLTSSSRRYSTKKSPRKGGRGRPSSRRRSTRSTSDDEFIDDEEKGSDVEYRPRPSKSRGRASPKKSARKPCTYAAKCYRKNREHKKEYSHPGDDDWSNEGNFSKHNSSKTGDRTQAELSDSEGKDNSGSAHSENGDESDEHAKGKTKRKSCK